MECCYFMFYYFQRECQFGTFSVYKVSLSCLCVYFTIELSMNLLYIQSVFVSIIVSVVFAVLLQGSIWASNALIDSFIG